MAKSGRGRIKRIKLRNFMTYEDIEIFPKNGLNLIVGLNGSGKSSIMCAICLGLAGKPHFTGRTSKLSDFIKYGKHEAEIEIELETVRTRSIVICRKIREGRSEWYLNRKPSNQIEVIATVKNFNINTNNLCQFLPQEKVVDFSRMDKKQRLENLLQAIGEPHLFDLLNELKNLYQQSVVIEADLKKAQEKKNLFEEKNSRIWNEVEKQENRIRLKKELVDLFNKRKLQKYLESHKEIMTLKKEYKKQRRDLILFRDALEKADAEENVPVSEYLKATNELEKLMSQRLNVSTEITAMLTLLEEYSAQVHNAKIEYENKLVEEKTRKKRLEDIDIQIEYLKTLVEEKMKEKPAVDQQLKSKSQELELKKAEISELAKEATCFSNKRDFYEYSYKYLKTQIAQIKDEYNKKMANLKRLDKCTYDAVCWLNENKNRFKSRIYQPIMLEINVHSPENCKYLEHHILRRDMFAFVCEDKEDCKHLTDVLRNKKKLPVNIVMAPDCHRPFRSPTLRDFRRYGLECFLIDLFTAPEPVMRYLCACYNVHNIPVAKSRINVNEIETIIQKFNVFFHENIKVVGRRSRYGDKNWSVRSDFIFDKNFLVNTNDEHGKKLEKNLQDAEYHIQSNHNGYENLRCKLLEKDQQREQLQQQINDLHHNLKKISDLSMRLQLKKYFKERISVVINEEEEKVKVSQKIELVNEKRKEVFKNVNELLKNYTSLQKEIVNQTIYSSFSSKEIKRLKKAKEIIYIKFREFEEVFDKNKAIYYQKKATARELLTLVKKFKIDATMAHNLETLEETEEKIHHLEAQLSLSEANESIVKEFQSRKKSIEAVTADISKLENILKEINESIETKKQKWLEPLQHHISNINKRFSTFFKKLCCVGEISLDIPENLNNYSSYGLEIKLKFRNDEPLIELSQAHHSGGECSVAAIVFILSLQELTDVPFRCIDEINQGMDSTNERNIYQLISDNIRDHGNSQYFLLTPKLLMDLQYPDDAAVHVIYNSPFMSMKLDIKKLLKIAHSL